MHLRVLSLMVTLKVCFFGLCLRYQLNLHGSLLPEKVRTGLIWRLYRFYKRKKTLTAANRRYAVSARRNHDNSGHLH
ncbi:hypothetical protein F5Y17DRAFT_436358 [Xylariaceae sp. FL0594]|nr:hypothetical protein F5Y17DRAFT_436358 [Xylariaceae sp. FL0594]